jgi:hypothetical protein
MLSIRSLLPHWPGLPADLRDALAHLDPRDGFALLESAELLAARLEIDLEDACELVGVTVH